MAIGRGVNVEFRIWNPEFRRGLQPVSRRQVFHLNPSFMSNTELQIDYPRSFRAAAYFARYPGFRKASTPGLSYVSVSRSPLASLSNA
jgi:hypothetical protein